MTGKNLYAILKNWRKVIKQYFRVMLGAKSVHAEDCYKGSFIGADYGIEEDLSSNLPDNWKTFNANFIPVYMNKNPGKTKVAAGLSCGQLWTICKGIKIGDILLCPDGQGFYFAGEITTNYYYKKGGILPHRRSIKWFSDKIDRSSMSEGLKNSTGSIGTVSDITKYSVEIEGYLKGDKKAKITVTGGDPDDPIEDPSIFAMEKHLEDFLI